MSLRKSTARPFDGLWSKMQMSTMSHCKLTLANNTFHGYIMLVESSISRESWGLANPHS